jgi:hypothetical protein
MSDNTICTLRHVSDPFLVNQVVNGNVPISYHDTVSISPALLPSE